MGWADFTEEEQRIIVKMRGDGNTFKEIGEAVGRRQESVGQWYRKHYGNTGQVKYPHRKLPKSTTRLRIGPEDEELLQRFADIKTNGDKIHALSLIVRNCLRVYFREVDKE